MQGDLSAIEHQRIVDPFVHSQGDVFGVEPRSIQVNPRSQEPVVGLHPELLAVHEVRLQVVGFGPEGQGKGTREIEMGLGVYPSIVVDTVEGQA